MLLVFDIGNSNIVLGTYEGRRLMKHWRISTDRQKTGDEYGMLINNLFRFQGIRMTDIDAIIISSVVPPLVVPLVKMCERYFRLRPLIVGPGIKTGIRLRYENPREIGADRIVNAVAVLAKYGGPAIIIDTGTATTFCAVTEKGEYLGGAIAPGMKISAESLFVKTAQLPNIELEKPERVICRNTIESMQAGLVYGHMGMVEYIVGKMKEELAEHAVSDRPIQVIATGGMAYMIDEGVDCIDVIDKELTLEGLLLIYNKNKKK